MPELQVRVQRQFPDLPEKYGDRTQDSGKMNNNRKRKVFFHLHVQQRFSEFKVPAAANG